MSIRFVIEDGDQLVLRIVLDPETSARLLLVSDEAHTDPGILAGAILHDVLKDDAIAHNLEVLTEPPPTAH